MTIFLKDPGASLDYAIDWAAGYLAGQSIVTSAWAVSPAGEGALTATAARIEGAQTLVSLTGGQAGCVYRVVNAVVFSDGGRDERSLVVRVEDR